MALDKNEIRKKLNLIWKDNKIPVLETKGKKLAFVSDIHLGDGGNSDDFHDNEKAMLKALDYYYKNDYSIGLLGDIEELWQFDLTKIEKRYGNTVYKKLKEFERIKSDLASLKKIISSQRKHS